MKTIFALLTLTLASPTASATCAQIYDALEYVCYVDGGRQVQVTILEQEICGASYKAMVNKTPVTVVAGPIAQRDGGVVFEIDGPRRTSQILGPCVESRIDIVE